MCVTATRLKALCTSLCVLKLDHLLLRKLQNLYSARQTVNEMAISNRPPANGFVRAARRVYNPIGFSKGYNFILFFIFAGALLGFTLARFQYLSFDGVFCKTGDSPSNHAAPGEVWLILFILVRFCL